VDVASLFEEHYDVLYRFLVRMTADSDVAADVAQESFIRLIERQPEEQQIRGWLFRVATNLVRDDSRVRRRRLELLEEFPDRAPVADAPANPETVLELNERRKVVRAALDRLSLKDRTLLLMREEGFSHHEIARAVGTTTKSVGSMIARALKKLSKELSRSEIDL
jgi:RNA polymerase sigma factor (sigma-70 family)